MPIARAHPHPSTRALTMGTLEEKGFTQSLVQSVSEVKSYFILIKEIFLIEIETIFVWTNTNWQVRGIGTDVGIVSSMVFLAQFILSLTMGTIIEFAGKRLTSGTTTLTVSKYLLHLRVCVC